MAKKATPPPADTPSQAKGPDWDAIEVAYRGTLEPVCSMAKRFGVYDNLIRRRAKKMGWIRCPAEEKRRIVSDALAGVSEGMSDVEVRHAKAMEAAVDILDMKTGIDIHRNILSAMKTASEKLADQKQTPDPDPRVAKVIAEAAEKSINGLREIRELNKGTMSHSSEELDAVIEAALEGLAAGGKAGPP